MRVCAGFQILVSGRAHIWHFYTHDYVFVLKSSLKKRKGLRQNDTDAFGAWPKYGKAINANLLQINNNPNLQIAQWKGMLKRLYGSFINLLDMSANNNYTNYKVTTAMWVTQY